MRRVNDRAPSAARGAKAARKEDSEARGREGESKGGSTTSAKKFFGVLALLSEISVVVVRTLVVN
jgi:hypothetical protein